MTLGTLRPCPTARCHRLLRRGEQCPDHPKRDTRPSARKRGYDATWEKVRALKLAAYPRCEFRTHCDGAPATEVDHKDGNPWNRASENLRSACKPCHSARTARDQTRSEPGWRKHERPAPVFG